VNTGRFSNKFKFDHFAVDDALMVFGTCLAGNAIAGSGLVDRALLPLSLRDEFIGWHAGWSRQVTLRFRDFNFPRELEWPG